jgi:hypothetical protein
MGFHEGLWSAIRVVWPPRKNVSSRQGSGRKGLGRALCGLGSIAGLFSVAAWIYSPLLLIIGWILLLALFVVAVAGGGLAIVYAVTMQTTLPQRGGGSPRDRPQMERLSSSWLMSDYWGTLAVVVTLVTLGMGVSSLFSARGFSQNPPWTLSRCKWSIGTNHGKTEHCVSRARWESVGDDAERSLICFLGTALGVEAAVILPRPLS